MKMIGRVLYIINDNIYLHVQDEAIVLKIDSEEKMRLPLCSIEEIVIIGNTTISNYIIDSCSKNNITISYIGMYGNFIGRFYGKTTGNVFLRKQQYELYDTKKSIEFSKNIILCKSINSSTLLKYYAKHTENEQISAVLYSSSNSILNIAKNIENCTTTEELLGIEGSIASIYFSNFDYLLKNVDFDMKFGERTKHPPLNNFNSILSLFYTLFTINITSALETFGIDSSLGYMHKLKSGRASLSCDIIEEFRAIIIDKFVIKLINLKQIKSNDFEKDESGIHLKQESLKNILNLWEKYKNESIFHPLLKEKIEIKLLPYIQAQYLAKYIRGEIEEYPSFYCKLI